MSLQAIAHYRFTAKLGEGGMGEVYRATDTKLGRDVAIKILPEAFAHDAERMARFAREAQVLAALNHPNIAAIYGVEERAIVMELVEGKTLAGPLPMDTALDYARQIAVALEAAHEKGIIHRDLKPANVKVTPEGVVKVLDFGLAKLGEDPSGAADAASSPTLTMSPTRAGWILGTAAYMAPEQARGAAVDKRADIWAFGVVLYEMLAGKAAFTGESTSDILAAVLQSEPDWSALPAETPPRIRKLLRRCLDRDRKQRLRDIGEARIAIDAPEQEQVIARPAPSRRWIPLAAAAGVPAIALGLAVIARWRAVEPVPHPFMRLTVELPPKTVLGRGGTGADPHVALSPDGTRLAVAVLGPDGKIRLATQLLDQGQFTMLTGTERANSPVFSSDGQWIGFFADSKLRKIAVRGGVSLPLGDATPRGASWGDDGNIIAAGLTDGLSRIPSAGGTPTPATELKKGERAHHWPQVLPGSQAVLFTAYGIEDSDIDLLSFPSGQRQTLHHGGSYGRYLPSGHLVYLRENTLFAAPFDLRRQAVTGAPQPVLEDVNMTVVGGGDFDFSQTGTFVYVGAQGQSQRSIFWLNSSGKIEPLHPDPGQNMSCLQFSADGKHLAFGTGELQSHDIWVQDLERNTTSKLVSTGSSGCPVWTPDTRHILVQSLDQRGSGIYWIRSDGSGEPQRLTGDDLSGFPSSVSADGKWLSLVKETAGRKAEIWTVPVEGSGEHPRLGKPELFLQLPFAGPTPWPAWPTFSPDGRWLAYSSNESGAFEVYVRPFPGPGGRTQISTDGGRFPIWSRNARELVFRAPDGRIMVVRYTAKGDSFAPGVARVWFAARSLGMGPIPTYDLAPDGQRFAIVLNPDGTAEEKAITHLTVLLNFFDELKRRVPSGGK